MSKIKMRTTTSNTSTSRSRNTKRNAVTLRTLSPGETFRFPRSQDGTVYQLLEVSDRADTDDAVYSAYRFMYSNVKTGQVFGDFESHEVVPVDCSLTVRERT